MRRPFQFNLSRLFAATTCLALAVWSGKNAFSKPMSGVEPTWFLICCTSFGAAVGVLTRNAEWGAVAGIIAADILLLIS
jgi:hypothetical protein